MISNDERREVAARLREQKPWSVFTDFQDCIGDLCDAVFDDEGDLNDMFGLKKALAELIEPEPINGETSDGYHTFNELYHHRALLFRAIVRNYPELCWKSKKHHTGDMYDGMFIVGINTPDGQASYHYDIDPYWDMFECEELEFAPEWDGHTPDQAIERIGKLTRHEQERTCRYESTNRCTWVCTSCGREVETRHCGYNYCPKCGARIIEDPN